MTESHGTRKQDIVCILGMHRSGTSLLTRILNVIGLYLGPENVLAQEGDCQPTGHWEHGPIMNLNHVILVRQGGSWDEPPVFPPGWEISPAMDDLKQEARTFIQESFENAKTWGWKDPRTCLTLPFWQQLLPEMRYVLCLRNPVDVAHSLANRNGFSAEKSSSLWLTHVTSALQHSDGFPRLTVFYEDLIDNLPRELSRLAAYLGMPDRAGQPDVQKAAQAFMRKELQHHRTSIDDLATNPNIAPQAKELFLAQWQAAHGKVADLAKR
jgi:hypothetical protein